MDTPPPVDLNKLKGILGTAKQIMGKVEKQDFSTGHVDGRALTEDGVAQLQSEGVTRPQTSAPTGQYSDEQVHNSNLPEAVKKAMLTKRIAQPTPNHTFNLDNVADLVEDKPMGHPKTPTTRVNENIVSNSDMITISKSELNNMINERLLEFFTKTYNKTLTEDTIKKTINTLIKEGKLTVKKKG